MMPFGNVLLGTGLGILALVLGGIKLVSPATPWHRRGGWFAALASLVLFGTMVLRTVQYQVALSWWSRIHVVLGMAAFLVFIAKFCASRKWYLTPRLLRPLGFTLTALFPLAAFGLALPILNAAASWAPLQVNEVTRDPDQESFNQSCIVCHSRETAVDDLGIRTIPDWITITEPMAWAGGLSREHTRGALGAILATSTSAEAGSYSLPIGFTPHTPIEKYCIRCHDKNRTLVQKTPELWRLTISRMQGYAQKLPNAPEISDEEAKEVLEFLCQKQP
ncbi:MAG: hypothetical protein WA705_00630 [Candidatus Ozemobacteraceae bacterium]